MKDSIICEQFYHNHTVVQSPECLLGLSNTLEETYYTKGLTCKQQKPQIKTPLVIRREFKAMGPNKPIVHGQERRQFTRVDFDASVKITQNNALIHTHLIDISLNGLLVKTPNSYELQADQTAQVKINLSANDEINMTVSLVHSSERILGFRCETIDMESVTYLRRLLELNIGEESAPDRVLSQLVKTASMYKHM